MALLFGFLEGFEQTLLYFNAHGLRFIGANEGNFAGSMFSVTPASMSLSSLIVAAFTPAAVQWSTMASA